jgi:hypothetical protein
MAFTDSGAAGSPQDSERLDSSGTEPGGQEGNQEQDSAPDSGGPVLAALQRQLRGPRVSAPGPGNTADSLGKLKIAIDLMQLSLNGFEEGTPQRKDIERSLEDLRRHLPEMGNQSGLEQTHLIDLLRRQRQNPVLQAISGLLDGGKDGGRKGQPPNPSTPLPGA